MALSAPSRRLFFRSLAAAPAAFQNPRLEGTKLTADLVTEFPVPRTRHFLVLFDLCQISDASIDPIFEALPKPCEATAVSFLAPVSGQPLYVFDLDRAAPVDAEEIKRILAEIAE